MTRPARPQDGIAWVTGASSGIGEAVARQLLADGWQVALTARNAAALQALADAHPGRAFACPGDVTDPAAMVAVAAAAEQEAGRPIALALLNAGRWKLMGAEDFSFEAFRDQMEVNLLGTAACLAAVMPGMIGRRAGQIGIVASVAGYMGLPMATGYGPTKAALINLAESLRVHLHPIGVLMQVINPGFVRTPMTDTNRFPMPGIIEADDAARRICRGLRSSRFEIAFPPATVLGLKLLRALPYALSLALLARAAQQRR